MDYGHRWHSFQIKVNRGTTPETKKVVKSEIELGLPYMVSDIVHKYQISGM